MAVPACATCIQCVQTMGDPLACLGSCMLMEPATQTLLGCVSGACGTDCGLAAN